MKKLNIEITKAQLTGYKVDFDDEDGHPQVYATIALLTANGRKITDYTIYTDSYSDQNKFELPLGVINPIFEIGKQLEAIVTKHCKDSQLALSAPTDESEIY